VQESGELAGPDEDVCRQRPPPDGEGTWMETGMDGDGRRTERVHGGRCRGSARGLDGQAAAAEHIRRWGRERRSASSDGRGAIGSGRGRTV
jgi:hypothetical protein